jgi:uncharacterized protein YbbK (DUF523 family)
VPRALVSACLLGEPVRLDGGHGAAAHAEGRFAGRRVPGRGLAAAALRAAGVALFHETDGGRPTRRAEARYRESPTP